MSLKLIFSLLLITVFKLSLTGQVGTYTVFKAPFSSDKYDEFSPVYYMHGIVFCSNRTSNRVLNYSSDQDKGLFKIYYTDTVGKVNWQESRLLSKYLKTNVNDGPVTFSRQFDTIYYSRNIEVNGKPSVLSSARNKLGIFNAVFDGQKWTKIRELRINDEWYNVTTPSLSPDSRRLYFASDKPGGFGGSDLYYCEWKGEYWSEPVNLGPAINTPGNEAYPFINPAGELFFSSEGHKGLGGKDIFFSRFADTAWLAPVPLDAPINSEHDDFGFICDSLMNEGYFSSTRERSIDIFKFKTNFPQIFYCENQRENQYCFRMSDRGAIEIDTVFLKYKWVFGQEQEKSGEEITPCFEKPGRYNVRLDIVDKATGKLFFPKLNYIVELSDFKQAYINSPDYAIIGDTIEFDGLKSNFPGYKIVSYTWDFNDGIRNKGARALHVYEGNGEFLIKLGLILKSDSTGIIQRTAVSKKITIFRDLKSMENFLEGLNERPIIPDIKSCINADIETLFSAEENFSREAIFQVKLKSSATKLGVNNNYFKSIPSNYNIEEIYDEENSIYDYIVDRQMTLMAAYPAYREMLALGYKDVKVEIVVLKDPAEKELNDLIKKFGAFADTYFDSNSRLTSNAYIMLDQISKLINKYPDVKLEIAVHTDNSEPPNVSHTRTQNLSEILVKYLVSRGINSNRFVAKGFGRTRPIASNLTESGRKLNRRIDFRIIKY